MQVKKKEILGEGDGNGNGEGDGEWRDEDGVEDGVMVMEKMEVKWREKNSE